MVAVQPEPFSIFAPFSDRLTVTLFTKEDDAPDEDSIAAMLKVNGCAGLWQVHGNRTIIMREADLSAGARRAKADGMITDVPGLALTVRTADCQPFMIFAPEEDVLGVLHVGWRGLIAGAITEFYKILKKQWGIEPQETYIGAGPSLCTACADFTDPTKELPNIDPQFIHGNCVDLQGAADAKLLSLGVPKDHLERSSDCTRCNPDRYWTYRGGDKEAVHKGKTNVITCVLTSA